MAILVINRTDSYCSACKHGADPMEVAHVTRLGWNPPTSEGCGEPYDSVSSDYVGVEGHVKWMRPDLPFINPLERLGL